MCSACGQQSPLGLFLLNLCLAPDLGSGSSAYLVGAHLVAGDQLEAGPVFILNIWWLLLALNISPYNCTIEFHPVFVRPCFQFVTVVWSFIPGFLSVSHPTKFRIVGGFHEHNLHPFVEVINEDQPGD